MMFNVDPKPTTGDDNIDVTKPKSRVALTSPSPWLRIFNNKYMPSDVLKRAFDR